MCTRHGALALCAVACLQTATVRAQDPPLTFTAALAQAREHAPDVTLARLRLEETRARLAGASIRLQSNPEIEADIGSRTSGGSRTTDLQLGIGQAFEPGGRRAARIAGAAAAVAQGTAEIEAAARVAVHRAAAAFHRALHAGERVRLLQVSLTLAERTVTVAERRFAAGDIAILDLNVARAARARVRADLEAGGAARAAVLGELRHALGLDGDLAIAGALAGAATAVPVLATLLEASARHPELRALEAAVQEAEAEARLGRTFTRPDLGVGVRYAREDRDHLVMGGLTVTLPAFARGQELLAAGTARAARLRAELDAARLRIGLQVRVAHDVYIRRLEGVRLLEAEALSTLDENDTLATRSFDAGQLALPDLLLIRRETLETRVQHLDALLEAALARIELDASAAILR